MAWPAPRTRASKASAVTLGLALAALVLGVCGGGCEAIVPGSVEPFHCGSTALSSCPAGETCATSTGQCVSASQNCTITQCTAPLTCDPGSLECINPTMMMGADASMDAPMVDSARPPPADVMTRDTTTMPVDSRSADVTPDVTPDASCGVGCPCTAASADCKGASLFCADNTVLAVPSMPSLSICTQVCCTSGDCPDGSVCYASGTPGNYCVPIGLLSITSTGAALGGAECGDNGDCRSGTCDPDTGNCVDTCCSDSSCSAGTFCAIDQNTPGTLHQGFYCLAESPPGASAGSTCEEPTDCSSNACLMIGTCTSNCCGAASCSATDGNVCGTNPTSTPSSGDSVNVCATNPGGMPFGSPCTEDDKCTSQVCDMAQGKCTDFCCVDQDCAGFGTGYVCRPRTGSTPPFLICVKSS
jgi:hypothetical protein